MKPPVFIVGCPRSGTTLLYSMLLAAGGFAAYRKETHFYHLAARFPSRMTARGRRQFERLFMAGYLGKVPGVPVERYVRDALSVTRTYEEFLPALLDTITRAQRMDRWVEGTPAHVLYMRQIKRAVPDALFVHVIRDGRDCALSYERQNWTSGLPADRRYRVGIAALYWEFMVRAGRAFGRDRRHDYLEVRFEDLIADPRATLNGIGAFLDHDLDYDRMLQNPRHSLHGPNTSFRESRGPGFNPVGRWRAATVEADVRLCETLVGSWLDELGYERAWSTPGDALPPGARFLRGLYLGYFATKHRVRVHTPLGRFITSTAIWSQQPRTGELPVHPVSNSATNAAAGTVKAVTSRLSPRPGSRVLTS